MTLEQFLSLIATIFGAIGSVYVLRSILKLTPQITVRLSASVYGYNSEIIDSLSTQKAESVVGTVLILIALFIAVINSATTPSSIIVHPNRIWAILFNFILCVVVYLFLLRIGSRVISDHRSKTARIIVAKNLDRLFKNKNVPINDIKSLRHLYEKFINIKIPSDLSNKEFLQFIANDVACIMPEGIQVEEESPK